MAAIGAAALLLTACTGGSTEGGSTPGTEARDVLVVGAQAQIADLNPLTGSAQGKSQTLSAIAAPILYINGANEVVSDLLEEWSVSDDALTVTFTLKSGMKWSDDEPITSEDLRQSLAAYLAPGVGANAGAVGPIVGKTELGEDTSTPLEELATPGLVVVDEQTLEIKLDAKNAIWPTQWALIGAYQPLLPSHVLGGETLANIKNSSYFTEWPVSAGPYTLTSFALGESAETAANPNWPGGTPGFEKLVLKYLTADQAIAQLQTGEVQYISPVAPADLETVSGISGITVASAPQVYPDVLALNYVSPNMQDVRVRQAITYAIDRETICERVLGGSCTVTEENYRLLGPDWAFPTSGVTAYPFDPDKAKDLLAEAGWDSDTTLSILTRNSESPAFTAQTFTIIQQQLADVGIKVDLVDVSTADLLSRIQEPETSGYDGFWINGANFAVDPGSLANYYACANRYPAGSNTSQFCNPDVDDLLALGLTQTDATERAETYQSILATLNQDPTEIAIYVVDLNQAHDERLVGPEANGWMTTVFSDIGRWTWS
ncbi:ABC transporter substrate-binding protein [Microbacterium sp. MC2]